MTRRRKRQIGKLVKHLLHDAKHARHMREDIVSPEEIAALTKKEAALRAAWAEANEEGVGKAAQDLADQVGTVYPAPRHAKMREYLEILVVALTVAMAFRTYFVQPFKIPTGSMQPTLYGITVGEQLGRKLWDYPPLSIVPLMLFGERYQEIKSPLSGQIVWRGDDAENSWHKITGSTHATDVRFHKDMSRHFTNRDHVSKGQVLASGRIRRGDHIFVNKIRYNFSRPKRGDIFVFSTDDIKYPQIRKDSFYIKRLAGLPGERVSIDPPYLMVDGEPVTEPYAFERMVSGEGYPGGYSLIGGLASNARLRSQTDSIQLNTGEYLPLGDNTHHSLDGRFFGVCPNATWSGPPSASTGRSASAGAGFSSPAGRNAFYSVPASCGVSASCASADF